MSDPTAKAKKVSTGGEPEYEAKTDHKSAEDDRVMKDVVAPPKYRLSRELLYPKGTKVPNLKVLRDHLLREGRIEEKLYVEVVKEVMAMLSKEPNVLALRVPITVVGDIHGQFFDLDRLFGDEYGGDPLESTYLFLGDYVDRGCFSTEVIMYLFCLKLNFGDSFRMLRGNHECRQLTAHFNFKDECLYKYSEDLYDSIMDCFDHLPLAAVVTSGSKENEQAFFCVHGGLSPDITSIDEIDDLNRFKETPREGPMCDLLWSDPCDEDKKPPVDDSDSEEALETDWFSYNQTRQCSYLYGVEAVKQFLEENNITSIIRAHEAQGEGFKIHMREGGAAPKVITIFSAPNYCDIYGNKGAILRLSDGALGIKQFREVPHPYYLPNFMDVFEWSLPFVAEKVTDMLTSILDIPSDDEEEEPSPAKQSLIKRGGKMKKKINAAARLIRLHRTLKENKIVLSALKELTPDRKLPLGLLHQGSDGIRRALAGFKTAKMNESINEAIPLPKKRSSKERRRSRRFSRSGSRTLSRSGESLTRMLRRNSRSNSELAIIIGEEVDNKKVDQISQQGEERNGWKEGTIGRYSAKTF